jgi:hypothetical protein
MEFTIVHLFVCFDPTVAWRGVLYTMEFTIVLKGVDKVDPTGSNELSDEELSNAAGGGYTGGA